MQTSSPGGQAPGRWASTKSPLRSTATLGVAALIAAMFLVSLALGASATKSYRLSATLNTAQQVPKPRGAAGGVGAFTATITPPAPGPLPGLWVMHYRLTWSHLSSPVTSAEIHFGKPGKVGPLAGTSLCGGSSIGVPCASGVGRGIGGEMQPSTGKAIVRGVATYIEVHTKKNPAGEIRGQIKLIG